MESCFYFTRCMVYNLSVMNRSEVPILQQIQDKFDVYEQVSDFAGSDIYRIGIDSSENGYEIVAYRGGYDGLRLAIEAEGGIFGTAGPKRVETSKDYGEVLLVNFEEPSSSMVDGSIKGTISKPAAREGLILPGDEGFELFTALHEKIQGIKFPIQLACDMVVPHLMEEPKTFALEDEDLGHWNHGDGTWTHKKTSEYRIADERGEKIVVFLHADALVEDEDQEMYEEFEDRYIYTSGGARIEEGDSFDISIFKPRNELARLFGGALSDFSYLHGKIEDLYLPE